LIPKEKRFKSIADRVRRKRQRLPSNGLIESAPARRFRGSPGTLLAGALIGPNP